MKKPVMSRRLLRDWVAMPKVLEQGIQNGLATCEPRPEWVPLKGLSAISDVLPPQAYAEPGFAYYYNEEIRKFRRREAISAFMSGMSKSELEAWLETYALFMTALVRPRHSVEPVHR
jgi:hypothetical protein